MGWNCLLGSWFNHECNFAVGAIILFAFFLCVVYIFCLSQKVHHHHYGTPPPIRRPAPIRPPPPPLVKPPVKKLGTPYYTIGLKDRHGDVMGRYNSTATKSTPTHSIHTISSADSKHKDKDIQVHYLSKNGNAHNWQRPTLNNEGNLEIKDYKNNMNGHIEVYSNGRKLARQEVVPER